MLLKKKLNKIKIIAEIGVNHDGDITKAKKLIRSAKKSGADYAKFQIYDTSEMVTHKAKKAKYQSSKMGLAISQKKMLEKYQLNEMQINQLNKYCIKIGIKFLASIFDEKSLEILNKIKVDFIKLPSSEITNYFLLKKIQKFSKKPIIFSTGMSSNSEIDQAYKILKKKRNITIPMYCVSSYPTKINEIKIQKMINLKKKYKIFGFSDHTKTSEAAILAVWNGACVIEKHLTYDNKAKGPDHEASLNPIQFAKFVEALRNTEILKMVKIKNKEEVNKKFVRKFLVAKRKILKGQKFNEGNVTCKRSGGGIDPFKFGKINNRVSKKNYHKDQKIEI